MEIAILVAISISGLLVSFTSTPAFGQPSKKLRGPFEEHGGLVEVMSPPFIWGSSLLQWR